MSERKYLSGAEKRKKQVAKNASLSGVPKLTTFFATTSSQSIDETDSLSELNNELGLPEEEINESNDLPESELPVVHNPSLFSNDPADWIVDEALREQAVKRPIVQNIGDFSESERNDKTQKRYLS